jgi:hypothetical protein
MAAAQAAAILKASRERFIGGEGLSRGGFSERYNIPNLTGIVQPLPFMSLSLHDRLTRHRLNR